MGDNSQNEFEEQQQDLNPHRQEELAAATAETRMRLDSRGITLTGAESPDELADLLSAVEEFEEMVEAHGGDLMVDDLRSSEPDDPHFVLPRRRPDEPVAKYMGRIEEAIENLRKHPAHPD
jgi:hypothetical protein